MRLILFSLLLTFIFGADKFCTNDIDTKDCLAQGKYECVQVEGYTDLVC